VATWGRDEFPRIVREAFRRQAYLVILDESGFMLTPAVRRTFAPRGRMPVLELWDRRDRLSVISCITLSPIARRPGLYFGLLDHNVHGQDVVTFLVDLHRRLARSPWSAIATRFTAGRAWSRRGWPGTRPLWPKTSRVTSRT
jgi:hypothetical protein